MNKRILAVFAVSAMLLSGCGSKYDINTGELASKLANEGSFAEQLTEVSEGITEKRYGLDEADVEECAAYAGTKAVVDEVAVFKAVNVENVTEAVSKHIDAQKETYSSYRPDELPKLESNLVKVMGDYVIVCISEDSAQAEAIISEYTK